MLLGNYSKLNANPGKNVGGFTNPFEWMKVSNAMSFYVGDHVVTDITNKANLYTGTRPPYALVLALKAGELATSYVYGIGSIGGANLAGGINIEAALAGTGTISIATGSLLAFATAALSGIGGLTADITGKLEASASLSGQGDIVGALGALSGAVCDILGTGSLSADITGKLEASASIGGSGDLIADISAVVQIQAALAGLGLLTSDIIGAGLVESDLTGTGALTSAISAPAHMSSSLAGLGTFIITSGAIPGYMEAQITLSTELSPENLAAAVWNAVAASFNSAGTMGEKMNDAGSASNPWTEVIEGSYTAAELLRLLTAVAAGKSTITDNGDGTKTIIFRDINDTRDTVEAEIEASERTSVTLDLT
jgi:hypothetical protein